MDEVYYFKGPVTCFGKVVSNCWYGETTANSKGKAKSNLEYQFKRECNKLPNSKVELIGNVRLKSTKKED